MKWEFVGFPRRRTCMLMVTHACNLNCSYCYESHKQNSYMELNMAKNIIAKEARFVENSDNFDELEIDFMGGEPFMNFPLIREVVEWLEDDAIAPPWICFVSTNATLLTEETQQWLRLHKNSIVLGASYDGNSKMQLANRGTKDYKIDLNFFHDLWPMEALHMTISKETLPSLAEGVLDIQSKGYKVEAILAQGVDWTVADAVKYREQLRLLKNAYLKDTNLVPISRLSRLINVYDIANKKISQENYCGSGKGMVAYDIDGKKYGCHMFTPLVLGKDNALESDKIDWKSPKTVVDDYCRNCVLRRFCPTCAGFNYRYRGSLSCRDKRWCTMILAEAISACEFQIEYISAMDKLDKQDAQHGQFAFHAYKILKRFDLEKDHSPYAIV